LLKQINQFDQDNLNIIQPLENEINPIIKLTNQDKCPDCKIEMEIYGHNECCWCCPKCGRIVDRCDLPNYYTLANGSVFERKKQVHNHVKHFVDWIDHILARDYGKFEESLDTIRNYIIQTNIRTLTPESLREILKNVKLSKYYKHTSYYFKAITNVGPPDIPGKYLHQAKFIFEDWTREKQKNRKSNNPSYPFLIYKVFDTILPLNDVENRPIFHFIRVRRHLQKEKKNGTLFMKKSNIFISQISRN
jgi:hypothetical protein